MIPSEKREDCVIARVATGSPVSVILFASLVLEEIGSVYAFKGWDMPFDNVTGDLIITAEYYQIVKGIIQ